MPIPEGEQLELLGDTCAPALGRIPWEGTSPRALTKVRLGFILKAQAPEGMDGNEYHEECGPGMALNLKRPFVYEGAPTLLPLRR